MESFVIFIVEDDPLFGEMMEYRLRQNPDYTVYRYLKGRDCLAEIYRKPSVMTLDFSLPDMNGLEILKRVKKQYPDIEVVVVSGQEDIATAVDLLREGAYDYFTKDSEALQRVWNAIVKIREKLALKGEVENLREQLAGKFDSEKTILGQSPAIEKVHSLIDRAGKTNINVSITGETGTGKELVARAIHFASARKKKPFVAVNMAAIPKDLLESELFGHEKGAFTGALYNRKGRFEMADCGTIFFDEIATISTKMQIELLRVLETKQFIRVGGNKEITSDFRVICATNRDLKSMVEKGTFREDLYYRLNVMNIHIPPLRERTEDIPLLVDYFIRKYCTSMNKPLITIETAALKRLLDYPFPGNIRELENMIERSIVVGNGKKILLRDLPLGKEVIDSSVESLDEFEKAFILQILNKYSWNISRTAQALKVDRVTLYNKIKKYGLKGAE